MTEDFCLMCLALLSQVRWPILISCSNEGKSLIGHKHAILERHAQESILDFQKTSIMGSLNEIGESITLSYAVATMWAMIQVCA